VVPLSELSHKCRTAPPSRRTGTSAWPYFTVLRSLRREASAVFGRLHCYGDDVIHLAAAQRRRPPGQRTLVTEWLTTSHPSAPISLASSVILPKRSSSESLPPVRSDSIANSLLAPWSSRLRNDRGARHDPARRCGPARDEPATRPASSSTGSCFNGSGRAGPVTSLPAYGVTVACVGSTPMRRMGCIVAILTGILTGMLTGTTLCGTGALSAAGASQPKVSPTVQRELRQLDAAQAQVHTVCAKAHAGTGFDMVTFAGAAAAQLRASRMNPAPWNRLPRAQTAFACWASAFSHTALGVFVDQHGHRTAAPPVPALKCKKTANSSECGIPGFG
jgi:hypothetical protein